MALTTSAAIVAYPNDIAPNRAPLTMPHLRVCAKRLLAYSRPGNLRPDVEHHLRGDLRQELDILLPDRQSQTCTRYCAVAA